MKNSQPTKEFYNLFNYLFEFYNVNLFQGNLTYPMIVITRNKNVFGHYSFKRWVDSTSTENVDEIAINPLWFHKYPLTEICQTIVHEMCHQWQYHFGSPSRTGYHNKEWADKMIEIGLMPSSTGKEGGKVVGQKMADYPIVSGRFSILTQSLMNENIFSDLYYEANSIVGRTVEMVNGLMVSSEGEVVGTNKMKIKYSCKICNVNVWAKPDVHLICGECKSKFEQQNPNQL
ncbi:SprT-like domain-containing protein [Chryseobacterium oncorhynchi]|uniref:SprT domain-containing protein n=1 Tax=Chryseobacterium oncorhynchi TaxID=741074 RepID=A0A316WLI5_9FLAO|nr:SprT-like domain-containing protein [Chryseobacterium oncorhynchi]PWN60038.1 sprT domain-containing protein [Chryseobacterium oncorhynchi]